MNKICEIEYRENEKEYSLYPKNLVIEIGDYVIFKFNKGEEIGKITKIIEKQEEMTPKILYKVEEKDIEIYNKIREEEKNIYKICKEKIKELSLPIKLVYCHIQFDKSTLYIEYIAEKKVSIRQFMQFVAKLFKGGKIKINQIGARTYAKRFPLYGVCGRQTCCTTFLKEFESITTDLIKLQKLTCGIDKLTGLCGRLMCCITFEKENYQKNE